MNKTLKITLISLASLVGLVLIIVLIACWLVLTPARLTSIVKNQAPNFITCDFELEKAELTLVNAFPNVGLKIDNLVLVNPMDDSPSDTIAFINECVISVNIKKFIEEKQIIINECSLNKVYANLFTNKNGDTNIDIFPPSSSEPQESEGGFSYGINLEMLKVTDVDVRYTDLSQALSADIKKFNATAKGFMKEELINGDVDMMISKVNLRQMTDSTNVAVKLENIKLEGDANVAGDDIKADIKASSSDLMFANADQKVDLASLNFDFEGDVKDYDVINGNLKMGLGNLNVLMAEEKMLHEANLNLAVPVNAVLSTMDFKLGQSSMSFNDMFFYLVGDVSMPDNGDMIIDMSLNTNTLIVEDIIDLIPSSMKEELLDNIGVKGELQLAAKIKGIYNATSVPVVDAELKYNKGHFDLPDYLPYPVSDFNTSLSVHFDINDRSNLNIKTLKADMSNSSFSLSGNVNDFMNKMYCNLTLGASADLSELQSFIPEGIVAEGNVRLDATASFNKNQLMNMDLMKSKIKADILWNDMNLVYADTINVKADDINISFVLPNPVSEQLTNSLAAVTLSGTVLDAKVSEMITASLKDYNIEAQVSNILNETEPMSVYADYAFSRIGFAMDKIDFFANSPKGSVAMFGKNDSDDASYIAVYSGDSLSFAMGDEMSFATETISFNVSADYDDDQEDILLQWNPHAGVKLSEAVFAMSELPTPIYIPSVDFNYDSTGIVVNDSKLLLGNSDFVLNGKFTDVDEFLRKEALFKGDLDLVSHYTDVNQIMELFSGMGDTTIVEEEIAVTDTIDKEDEPFMVPLGINISLNTKIEKAVAGTMNLTNVGGGLTVKNGILVLQEMGFTTDAATMMLTAMYKSPRKNHLYLGMDLHLLDIDIAEMISIIPELDTVVPMLKSFAGNAEFHFAIETYLKSNYDPKISTLKGALAIEGKDLVVLDNETFRKLSRRLLFKDRKNNKIDNLSVELTVFKNEIDVYPTLIVIDKYQAIASGRHNLNMTFDYKLGMSNPWLFSWLGIAINGNEEKMKFKFKMKKNMDLENPRGDSEKVHLAEESLRLKSIIAESLKESIK